MVEETKKRSVLEVIDEIFAVFENVRSMLDTWTSGYHMSFIYEIKRLQKLEIELNCLGYDDDFVSFMFEHIYNTVFRYYSSPDLSACHSERSEEKTSPGGRLKRRDSSLCSE